MRTLQLVTAGVALGAGATILGQPADAVPATQRVTAIAYGTHPVAHCPAGYTVTGGGVHPTDAGSPVTDSQPSHNGWTGAATYYDKVTGQTIADTIDVYAVCIRQ